jgi:hypothetical protein
MTAAEELRQKYTEWLKIGWTFALSRKKVESWLQKLKKTIK